MSNDLFNQLIIASGKLATAADQANVVLSEEHESLTRPFIEEVRAILAQCPHPAEAWDGTLHEEDLEEKIGRTGHEQPGQPAVGVTIVHRPTGIGRESKSKPSQEENREVALKALTDAVAREYKARGSR